VRAHPEPTVPAVGLKGIWRDEQLDASGRVRRVGEWRSNLVVASCDRLLAALMKREPGVGGILFWAVGRGEEGWDASLPTPRPANTRLTAEVARLALAPAQVVYLDAAGQPSAAPTERLEVTARFTGSDLGGSVRLREFGLFGGDATATANSGIMVNQVIHPRIDLGPDDTLRRTVQLTFSGGSLRQGARVGVAPTLPVGSMDGVGKSYETTLTSAGLRTVGDLAEADPLRPVGNIPQATLRELRAKARMVLAVRLDPVLLAPLAGRRLEGLLAARPEDLAGAVGGLARATQTVVYLQERLGPLEVALDTAWLQRLRVEDLIPL